MLKFFLHILAPGVKLPAGASQYSLVNEGLSWGWAFFIFVFLAAAVVWSYRVYAPGLSRFQRVALIVLRSILLGLLLVLLVRPVLLITIEETVRRPLLVLLDLTQSMGLADHRTTADDLARLAMADGQMDPAGGLKQPVAGGSAESQKNVSRWQVLEDIAGNSRLNLWPRLYANADLEVYGFGRKLAPLGNLASRAGGQLTTDDATFFFSALHATENLTAVGDGLRDLLDQQRGQPLAGVLLITDGGNNTGSSPLEAAGMAKQDNVPLFIYGVGVTTPQDIIVSELNAPRVANVKERLQAVVHIRAEGMVGKSAKVQLKANGKIVDEQPIEFRADGEQELTLGYTPDVVGEARLEAYVPPLPEEAVKENNTASTRVRITDDKIKVLLIEDEPRWDYQYLLTTLQRDRRIQLKTILLKGDRDDAPAADSPFLARLPDDKETLQTNDLVIIGDVDPAELGGTRMKFFNDWVSQQGGSLIFLAGPKFDPNAYQGTPLEALLPVETKGETSARYTQPVPLKLTPAGEASPMLLLSQDPQENAAIWGKFPPVNWTAWVGKARPGAQVLLTDPTPARANRSGFMPVMALQPYGLGQTLFIGFDETYRWRSHVGEKYYTRIWGQIILALTRQRDSSALTQLTTDKANYLTGDTVRISGRIFKSGREPLTDTEVAGTITIKPANTNGQPSSAQHGTELRLQAVPDRPGEYRASMVAMAAGSYSFSTARDPATVLKFEVAEPTVELSDIAMNENLLRAMASAAGGEFLREEDLNSLPDRVVAKTNHNETFKKIPLVFTPYLLALMILLGCAEWHWRRKSELK